MKPEQAVGFPVPYGPWQSRTIGWVAKCEKREGIQWLLRQWQTSRVSPDFREALRSFFACPRYIPWLQQELGSDYPGRETFWLPEGHPGCRACGETAGRVEVLTVSCSHGLPQGMIVSTSCECGYAAEKRVERKVDCEACGRPSLRLVTEG